MRGAWAQQGREQACATESITGTAAAEWAGRSSQELAYEVVSGPQAGGAAGVGGGWPRMAEEVAMLTRWPC
jgi:hypothetical protein